MTVKINIITEEPTLHGISSEPKCWFNFVKSCDAKYKHICDYDLIDREIRRDWGGFLEFKMIGLIIRPGLMTKKPEFMIFENEDDAVQFVLRWS